MRRLHLVVVNYFSSSFVLQIFDYQDINQFTTISIVDNSCDAAELAALELALSGQNVNIHALPENVGFGAAVNFGVRSIELADCDHVWILNPDTRPSASAAQNLVRTMLEEGADLASPVLTTGDGDDVWFGGGHFDEKRGRTHHFSERPQQTSAVNFLTGAALMVSGHAWHKLDGFREDLFMYWEDADLCLRASDLGYSMVVVPSSIVWHAVGATSSSSGRSALFYYYMQRNRQIVLAEHFGLAYLLSPRRFLESAVMAIRAVREDSEKAGKFLSSCRGLLAGIRISLSKR